MARQFWSPNAGAVGQQAMALQPGQNVQGQQAVLLDPSDLVYPAPGGGLLRVAVGGGPAAPVNGTGNGNLIYYDASAGLWLPTPGAPSNGQSPVWDALDNRWEFATLGLGGLQYFDNSNSPIGCWRFNQTVADFSGNGLDLSFSGSAAYAQVYPGKWGAALNSGAFLNNATTGGIAMLTGDVTFQVILQLDDNVAGTALNLCQFGATGETLATNVLYALRLNSMASFPRRVAWLSESGAGVDATFTSSGSASFGLIHNLVHVWGRRAGNVVSLGINGQQIGPSSAALTTPSGGTASSLYICGEPAAGTPVPLIVFSAKLNNTALSDAAILADYNSTLGPAFGYL